MAWFGSVWLGLAWLGLAWLGSARLGSARHLNHAKLIYYENVRSFCFLTSEKVSGVGLSFFLGVWPFLLSWGWPFSLGFGPFFLCLMPVGTFLRVWPVLLRGWPFPSQEQALPSSVWPILLGVGPALPSASWPFLLRFGPSFSGLARHFFLPVGPSFFLLRFVFVLGELPWGWPFSLRFGLSLLWFWPLFVPFAFSWGLASSGLLVVGPSF